MPARSNCSPPDILCTCGETRTYPVAVGLPPVGTEAMCLACGRTWKLDEYTFTDSGGTRWSWEAEDPPATNIKASRRLPRTIFSIDAALSALAVYHGPTRGMA
jgi:hypothetical protein